METVTDEQIKGSTLEKDRCVMCGREVLKIKGKKYPVCDRCANGSN